jgi:hypothetical protein
LHLNLPPSRYSTLSCFAFFLALINIWLFHIGIFYPFPLQNVRSPSQGLVFILYFFFCFIYFFICLLIFVACRGLLFFAFLVLGVEPRALNMLGKHSTTEIHPSPSSFLYLLYWVYNRNSINSYRVNKPMSVLLYYIFRVTLI